MTSIGESAFSNCSYLSSINISKNVTYIGESAFINCYNLTSVILPEGITSIENVTFSGCDNLASVVIPENVKTIGYRAFQNCYNLSITCKATTPPIFEDVAAFEGVNKNNILYVPKSSIEAYRSAEYWNEFSNIYGIIEQQEFKGEFPILLTESDGLLATKDMGQYVYTSPVYALDEATNEFFFTFLRGHATEGNLNYYDDKGHPFISLAEFHLFDGEGNEISLSADNFSTNAQEATEGAIANICDGDRSTFWHSQWSGDGSPDFHYLKVSLPEGRELSNFQFKYVTRYERQCVPSCIQISSTPEVAKYEFVGTCGKNLIWKLNTNKELEIEGIGEMTSFYGASNVPWMGYAIKSVKIKDGITSISRYAFYECKGLTSITLPSSITSIGDYAFNDCTFLKSIDLLEGITSIGYRAFYGCSSLTSLTLPKSVMTIGESAFYNCSGELVVNCNIPSNSFYYGRFSKVTIGDGVNTIGDRAFYGCSSLTSVIMPESVTDIGDWAFGGCYKLSTVITHAQTPPTLISTRVFENSSAILYVPQGTIAAYEESGWKNYFSKILELSSDKFASGTCGSEQKWELTLDGELVIAGQGDMAEFGPEGSPWKEYLDVVKSVTIAEEVTSIGNYAFDGCTSLESIYIPANIALIGECAFRNCRSLSSIVVAEENTTYDSRDNCNAIIETNTNTLIIGCKTSYIPEGVISIGDNAFYANNSLTEITIPESVTSIGENAFSACSSLQVISCYALTPPVCNENTFKNTNLHILYVPNLGAVESYKIAAGWSKVRDIKSMKAHNLVFMLGESIVQQQLFDTGDSIVSPYALNKEGYTLNWNVAKWEESPVNIADHADKMLYTNAPCTNTSWGDQFSGWHVLVDGKTSTFFHSEYNDMDTPDGLDHYIRVDLGEGNEVSAFSFSYATRPTNAYATAPTVIVVEGSNEVDGVYTIIETLTNLPTSNATNYESEILRGENSYRYIRFRVTATGGGKVVHNHPYFTMSEFGMKRYELKVLSTAPEIMADEDLMFTGSYSINKYLVTFKIGDEVITSDSLEYGTTIVVPDVPEREGYTFVGWSDVAKTVPAYNVIYEGDYSVNSYFLTYIVDCDTIRTDTIAYGSVLVAMEEPIKEGHTFSGWDEIPETMPANDVVISGVFTINNYIVSYVVDGEEYRTDSVTYGDSIQVIAPLEKEGYTFGGWSEVPVIMPADSVIVIGTFTVNSYTLTYTVDGDTVQTDALDYGTAIVAMEEPVKEGYTFSGWSEVPDSMPANDVTVSGTFAINKYLVTFKIGDEVIAADSLEYGANIVVPDAPEREGYTFAGWGEVAETVPAGDVTYEGSYSVNSYILTYEVDGITIKTDTIDYGAVIIAMEEPVKEGHTFSGWSEVPETMPAGDITISGIFTINKYLITFKIDDEVIASDSLEYGAAIVAPEAPEREGYTFDGWGEVAETVPAGDVIYEGSYTANTYKVYYYVGEELVHTAEVTYGEAIPEYVYEPTEEGYTFLGWIGDTYETMPAHDITYTANIEDGIEELTIDNSQLTIYDLTGRKVINTENLKGGIYIVNGKKVVIK